MELMHHHAEIVTRFCKNQLFARRNLPIRASEMGVLLFVARHGEAVTPLMISDHFRIAKPSLTPILAELTRRGYVRRSPATTDHRSYTVSITAEGQEMADQGASTYTQSLRLLNSRMGTERFQQLIGLLEEANAILESESVG